MRGFGSFHAGMKKEKCYTEEKTHEDYQKGKHVITFWAAVAKLERGVDNAVKKRTPKTAAGNNSEHAEEQSDLRGQNHGADDRAERSAGG